MYFLRGLRRRATRNKCKSEGICYKGKMRRHDGENLQKTSLLRLLLIVCGERPAVDRQDLFSECCRLLTIRTIYRRLPAALDRRLQTAKEFLAGFTAVQVGFDFFTGELVQFAVEVLRQPSEYLPAATGAGRNLRAGVRSFRH